MLAPGCAFGYAGLIVAAAAALRRSLAAAVQNAGISFTRRPCCRAAVDAAASWCASVRAGARTKSTPIVEMWLSVYVSSAKRNSRQDLPTPESPISTSLKT